jgi:hypothetical protein
MKADGLDLHAVRNLVLTDVIAPIGGFPRFLLVLGQVVGVDALPRKGQWHADSPRRHQPLVSLIASSRS